MSFQSRKTETSQRHGITLIFVVTMIVLFLLMGTAFVIVANDYFKSAHRRSTKHIYESDSRAILERAFYDLARGPALGDASSPLRGHSLLADMYGYGVTASVANAKADSSEHFLVVTLNGDAKKLIDGSAYAPEPVSGSLSGLLLSVVSGPAKGLTTRIVDHQVQGSSHKFILLPSRGDAGFSVAQAPTLIGSRVVINGRPFSGSGGGQFDPRAGRGQPALSRMALYPNQSGRSLARILGKTSGPGYFSVRTGSGTESNSRGPNESYDTFDFQNMFLAGFKFDGNLNRSRIERSSFYRPELPTNTFDGAKGDFRAFKRGGPNNDGVVVDNNNDGEPDGIWMDIGLSVENRPDGSCIKPLVSYLVVDLDGRINLNAHGSLVRDGDHSMSEIGLLGNPESNLKRGQGYGPPEITMSQVLPGSQGQIIRNRYGRDGQPGRANVRDSWSSYKLFGYPDGKFGDAIPGTVNGHFGSAMDVHGRFATGYPQIFDLADGTFPIGMPVANVGFSNLENEIVDSAYEMTFADGNWYGSGERRFDSPYTASELEAVFRQFDPDSQLLPKRLLQLGLSARSTKHSITTHSFEVPTTFQSLTRKLYEILRNTVPPEKIADQLRTMLPPEVFRGLPMNVNRAFGDGLDNNGNGVVDEMAESDFLVHPNGNQVAFDHDNDSITTDDFDSLFARITFAKHLYIVTLLNTERIDRNRDGMISPTSDWYDFNEDGRVDADDWIDYRKVVAQWAANVVDFRDPDSIMTPFEFDLNPWDGYHADGSILTTGEIEPPEMRYVVWGAERPELLISETFATHDRRTQDLETEDVPEGETASRVNDDEEADEDFDSHLVPKVSAFFELYNPWVMNDANQVRPAELYDETLGGVDLQKTSPDGTSPVWRLVVTEIGEDSLDPDDPSRNRHGKAAVAVRRIYFARPSFTVDSGPEVYFPSDNIDAGYVGPGRYAIVGTAGQKVGDRFDTYFGRKLTIDALETDVLRNQTRRISLDPENRRIQLVQWDPDEQMMREYTRSVVNLPIGLNDGGWERELGVSDPVDGYYNLEGVGSLAGGTPIKLEPVEDGLKFTENVTAPGTPTNYAFDRPIDEILNEDHYRQYLKNDGLVGAGFTDDNQRLPYRVVHLQRLANPLLGFDEVSNPYRTIDTCGIDLFAFNGADTFEDPNNIPGIMRFGTHERRGSQNSDFGQKKERSRILFKSDLLGLQGLENYPGEKDSEHYFDQADDHIFGWNFIESLGGLNAAYLESPTPSDLPEPFCWLTWNNRPFASPLELANVPHTSSYQMTRTFDMAADEADRNVYEAPTMEDALNDSPNTEAPNYSAQFPHLFNFYADQVEGSPNGPSLHRVFDYLEVPSRFVGTESYVNPLTFANDRHNVSFGLAAPFDTISSYRYPGKININTVLDPRVWNGLMGGFGTDEFSGVDYPQWDASRDGRNGSFKYSNPYRPAHSNNLVPPGIGVVDPVQCGLFRAMHGSNRPLFDYDSDPKIAFANDDRAAYFRNQMRQRLGNLVTSRSSVFAIWITVGYFEVKADGSLRKSGGVGVESGSESGEVNRPRAFFIMDRSIPVAFEPGKNHNVDRAVLVKTIIE